MVGREVPGAQAMESSPSAQPVPGKTMLRESREPPLPTERAATAEPALYARIERAADAVQRRIDPRFARVEGLCATVEMGISPECSLISVVLKSVSSYLKVIMFLVGGSSCFCCGLGCDVHDVARRDAARARVWGRWLDLRPAVKINPAD